jgi:GNAT superfamily N-acetyltransferase
MPPLAPSAPPADVARICAAHAWQRALGHASRDDGLCRIVVDETHPTVWDANHASCVRAATEHDIDQVLALCARTFVHCRHRLFLVDPLTPPAFVARVALDDYRELTPTIQMVLRGELRATPGDVILRPVGEDADWRSLAALVRADHDEGARSHDGPLPPEVTQGIVAGYRAKYPRAQFFLALVDGEPRAYGAAVACEDGVGMVEDLFTLPPYRRRGLATALIARAVQHVRSHGRDLVVIGAHASEPPKRLYHALRFVPACLTREYVKHL